MNILLKANLSDKTITNGGSAWAPPLATFDEAWTIALRLVETVDGNEIASPINVTGMAAGIGVVDAPPTGGQTALQIGDGAQTGANTTDPFPYNVTAAALQGLINAKTAVTAIYGAVTVRQLNGSFLIKGANGIAMPLQLRGNELHPLAWGRVTATLFDGIWIQELRCMQLPVDFTDSSERVLTPAPTVTELVMGGTLDGFAVNELQALFVRPDYAAAYTLKMAAGGQTRQLSVSDTPATVQSALEAVYGAGNFNVTDGVQWTANIEYIGIFAGTSVPLLTVTPLNPPLGDLTFTLPLNKAALLSRLRAQPAVTLPFEVRLFYLDSHLEAQKAVFTLPPITIQRPLIMPELADVPDQDWLRPPSPKDYLTFSPDTVITGQQYFPKVLGNGVLTVFVIAHGLATDAYFVWVRETTSGGRQLVEGVDYSVIDVDANTVSVTALMGAPALNAWTAFIMSAQTVAAFAAGLHVTMDQVTGLDARLTAIETNVATLLALAPSTPLGSTAAATTAIALQIPQLTMIFPGDGSASSPPDPAGGLLPAIHDATITSFTTLPLPSVSAAAGNVYRNDSGAALAIPGGLLVRQSSVPVGGYFGGDGRVRYPLTRAWGPVRTYVHAGRAGAGAITVAGLLAGDRILSVTDTTASVDVTVGFTSPIAADNTLAQTSSADLSAHSLTIVVQGTRTSFFPTPFEIELFAFEVNSQMFRAGSNFALGFTLSLALLNATSRAQYIFVLEHGIAPSQAAPATTSANLQDILWNPTPLITQRLILSAASVPCAIGVQIVRAAGGALSANKTLYGFSTAADSVPVSADMALRARLINFDTENSIPTARGTISMDTGIITAAFTY